MDKCSITDYNWYPGSGIRWTSKCHTYFGCRTNSQRDMKISNVPAPSTAFTWSADSFRLEFFFFVEAFVVDRMLASESRDCPWALRLVTLGDESRIFGAFLWGNFGVMASNDFSGSLDFWLGLREDVRLDLCSLMESFEGEDLTWRTNTQNKIIQRYWRYTEKGFQESLPWRRRYEVTIGKTGR